MKTHGNEPIAARTIKASEFKAKCLKLMDEVAESGEEIVITKNGRPVSRLAPCRKPSSGLFFGRNRDDIRILGDIVSPMPPEWYEKADDSDDELVREAARLTGVDEKTSLVRQGLQALIARESARRLAALGGSEKELRPIPRRRPPASGR